MITTLLELAKGESCEVPKRWLGGDDVSLDVQLRMLIMSFQSAICWMTGLTVHIHRLSFR